MWDITLTFNADGTVTMAGVDEEDMWTYFHYTQSGNTLTLIVGEDEPDDCTVGTITINGNTATYVYHWEDYDGKWEDDDTFTMTLQKQ